MTTNAIYVVFQESLHEEISGESGVWEAFFTDLDEAKRACEDNVLTTMRDFNELQSDPDSFTWRDSNICSECWVLEDDESFSTHTIKRVTSLDKSSALSNGANRKEPIRYFLDQDNLSSWYLIPSDCGEEWSAWRDLPEDDERSLKEPDWVKRISGVSSISFTDPV